MNARLRTLLFFALPDRYIPFVVVGIVAIPVLLFWAGCFDTWTIPCPYGEWPVQGYGGTTCVPR